MTTDEKYITRCLELARSGSHFVAPNPMVGSVIVHNNKIIGEGYHQKHGEAHAEVNALNSVQDRSLLKDSTLYVNLEPCSHHGKTPPCADLIVENKLKRVVIASLDSNPLVAGKGVQHLKDNGIEVKIGVLEEEAKFLNRRFYTFHAQKRPYIILKWARSSDGFIDKKRSDDKATINWISTKSSKRLVHSWRAEEAAILVGKNTVINDNPSLTTREVDGPNPIRVLIDPQNELFGSTTQKRKVFDEEAPTLVYNFELQKKVRNIEFIKLSKDKGFIDQLLNHLYTKQVLSIIIEGGKYTLDSFLTEDKWDEARVITGMVNFKDGLKAPELKSSPISSENRDGDTIEYYIRS